jgi:hypothetical protein
VDYLQVYRHDAFRYGGGLNRSAADVYLCLSEGPKSAVEIIQRTGRSRATVFRCLKRMSEIIDSTTGEIISMVGNMNGAWELVPGVELDHVALLIGTAGIGKRKQIQYLDEQKSHRKSLFSCRNQ